MRGTRLLGSARVDSAMGQRRPTPLGPGLISSRDERLTSSPCMMCDLLLGPPLYTRRHPNPTPLLDHSSWCAPQPQPAGVSVWQGDFSLSFESDLEGIGRQRIIEMPADPGEPAARFGLGWLGWGRSWWLGGGRRARDGLPALLGLGGVWIGGEGKMGVGTCAGYYRHW